LQTAFIEEQAMQCGFCTSGILMSAAALLQRQPRPTRQEIIQAIDGNLCRCGVHNRVVRAIEKAAARLLAAP
jgi:nicotinate dehydrogenase subunit A